MIGFCSVECGGLICCDSFAACGQSLNFHKGIRLSKGGNRMPEKETLERAEEDKREGKSPSTQAGEFVREEIHHIREGRHGAASPKQAIAIGLSKARAARALTCRRQRKAASLPRRANQPSATIHAATAARRKLHPLRVRAAGKPRSKKSRVLASRIRRSHGRPRAQHGRGRNTGQKPSLRVKKLRKQKRLES